MELILGAVVSLIVQLLKQYSSSGALTIGIAIAVSLIAAGFYTALVTAGYWESFANVLVLSSAIYALIISRFEKN